MRMRTERRRRRVIQARERDVRLHLNQAVHCSEVGRFPDAIKEYIQVLKQDPNNLTALNNAACVLMAMGNRVPALAVYKEAVRRYPNHVPMRLNLGNALLEHCEWATARHLAEQARRVLEEAREHFEAVLRMSSDCRKANEGLAYVWYGLGDADKAQWYRRQAFEDNYIIACPYRGKEPAVAVLQLVFADGNVRLKAFLDNRKFQRFVVLPEFYKTGTPLPPHQLVINGIGDADLASGALTAAESVLAMTSAPVINAPVAVLATTRSNNAKRLAGIPGVITPLTAMLTRQQLCDSSALNTLQSHGLAFPFLLRTPGFHNGLNFVRVESNEELASALETLPGPELLVMQYLDARQADGKIRKYRAMLIDGKIYPLHVAVSHHWKIHFATAEMADYPEHRAEDAAFLENMPGVIGPVAMKALEEIQAMLGLDYAGIDFSLNANGEVLVFEANATMVVLPPEADERWNYRRPAYERIFAAVQNMLLQRAQREPVVAQK